MTHHDHDHKHDHDHDHNHSHSHEHQDHGHGHCHKHEHCHGHNHVGIQSGEATSSMPEREKLVKLLEHWAGHNDDHASNYRQWAEKAAAMNLKEAARMLEEAAGLTGVVTEKFLKAKESIENK